MKKLFVYGINFLVLFLIVGFAYTSIFLELKGKTNLSFIPLLLSFVWIAICVILIIKFRKDFSKIRLIFIINSFLLVLILLISTLLGISGFNDNLKLCSDQIQKIAISPDKAYKAIAYIRNCGATTDFSPQVVLGESTLTTKEMIGENENIIFIGNHSNFIDIQWKDNNILEIVNDVFGDNIIKNIQQKYAINIIYKHQQSTRFGD